jgi:hypothetical protein
MQEGSGTTLAAFIQPSDARWSSYDYQLIRKENEVYEQRILIEENGIRFPSRYSLSEAYCRRRPQSPIRLLRSQLSVVYSHYQFFTVETQVISKGTGE